MSMDQLISNIKKHGLFAIRPLNLERSSTRGAASFFSLIDTKLYQLDAREWQSITSRTARDGGSVK